MSDFHTVFAHELSKKGGSWLGTARTWLQSNVINGDTVRWNSGERISMSVKQFEDCAAHIAAAAINQERRDVRTRRIATERAQGARAASRMANCSHGAPLGADCRECRADGLQS